MRILIVNAHATNPESQRSFQDLLAIVKEILRMRNGLLEMKDEYVVRSKDNLEDFLFDEYTSFSQVNPGKQFDALDFIVISGDPHLLPWHPSNFKVVTLIRMCLKVKKCLFAVGFAMQAVVYLAASNLDHPIHIINGNGKGGKLGSMAQLKLRPEDIRSDEYFLDNVTGDLYSFQHENNEWAPVCNVGLHHIRTAQEFHTIGKFIIKTPVYRPKKNTKTHDTLDDYIETRCYVKKVFLRHWLLQHCPIEFTVPYNGKWEVHSFSFTNKEKSFEVLAESENGPLVIEMQRIVGVKFLINKKYKETYNILSNFIMKYATDIMSLGKSQNLSILSYVDVTKSTAKQFKFSEKKEELPEGARPTTRSTGVGIKKNLGLRGGTASSPTSLEVEDNHTFKHSGMASKNQRKQIMDHNYISSSKIGYGKNLSKNKQTEMLTPNEVLGKYAGGAVKANTGELEYYLGGLRGSPERPILKGVHSSLNKLQEAMKKKHVSISTTTPPLKYNSSHYLGHKGNATSTTNEDDFTLTTHDARKMLYPELGENSDIKIDRKLWVPGAMSAALAQPKEYGSPKVVRVSTTEFAYRKKGPLGKIREETDKKSLLISSPYMTPYQINTEHQRREDLKILGPKLFSTSKDWSMHSASKTVPSSPPGELNYRYVMSPMGMDRILDY